MSRALLLEVPKTVYAGSGEGNFYANLGAGVYRSGDGGSTWKVIATSPFLGVGFYALVIDPQNRKRLYAATTSGFFVSTNAGSTWSQKRPQRCWSISVRPAGGAGSEILATFDDGLFVSTNAGASFAAVSLPSLPATGWTRLVVDRVIASPDIAYVFGAAGSAAHLWRRLGATWTKIAHLPTIDVNQAWYDWYVAVPPDKKNQVFLGAIDTFRGDLTGTTWRWTNITTKGARSIHPDQHCLAFSPGSSKIIYAGNDGGVYRSSDSGGTWTALNEGLSITEVEYMSCDPNTANWIMAGTQDNGTIRFVGSPNWDHIADGDGGDCGVNPLQPSEVYHSYYYVSLERSNNKGNSWTATNPPSMAALFYPPVSVHGQTVAIGGTSLAITRTGGSPWQTLALGLAPNDVATASCMLDANTIFVATQRGRVFRVVWTGANWSTTELRSPFTAYVSCIAVEPGYPQRIWVTSSQAAIGAGMVCRSDDGGVSWTNCTAGLPAIPKNSIAIDPADSRRVWVAADVGVYQSVNMGAAWNAFSSGLPNAMAVDLLFHKKDRKLLCGTRNRGVWMASVPGPGP